MSRIFDKDAEIEARMMGMGLRERAVVLSDTIDDPCLLEEINSILKEINCKPLERIDGYELQQFTRYLAHKAMCWNCKGLDCSMSGVVIRIMSVNGKHSFSTVYCSRYFELSKGIQKKTDAKKQRSKTEVLFDKRKGIKKKESNYAKKPRQGGLW